MDEGEPPVRSFRFPIELGKIRELSRATWTEAPEVLDGTVIPPTFLYGARMWDDEAPEQRPADPGDRGRLHAEQEFVFHGPPPGAGAVLTVSTRVDPEYEKRGRRGGLMSFQLVVTEYRDPDGRLVAEARQLGVRTSAEAGG
ncbi:hypothetical protein GCM10009836_56530 [Pseudonocardia ailaonensis]|uniref:FAS1-like dehydratase domain-containing protein n=1 Tax=Pseudonocardia ailaonensis TaxID=367279 RepID=A0ABN2NGV9_9PSEU